MRMLTMCCALVAMLTTGCQRHNAQRSETGQTERMSEQSASRELETHGFVIVIGDHTATDVLLHLQENSVRGWADLTDQAYAKLIIVAEDATQGLTIHEDILNDLNPNEVRGVLWLMTNCDLVDDLQLLELEELEARTLLNQNGLSGDVIQFAFDFATAGTDSSDDRPRGWPAILQYISDVE